MAIKLSLLLFLLIPLVIVSVPDPPLTLEREAYCWRTPAGQDLIGIAQSGLELTALQDEHYYIPERECWVHYSALGIEATPTPFALPYFALPQAEYWRPVVDQYISEFPNLEVDWVIAVIAKESWGNRYMLNENRDGTVDVGLMQVTADRWAGAYEDLHHPNYNVWTGMWILNQTLEKTDGDLRWALAAYNCGFASLEADRCYSWGGWVYADQVLQILAGME